MLLIESNHSMLVSSKQFSISCFLLLKLKIWHCCSYKSSSIFHFGSFVTFVHQLVCADRQLAHQVFLLWQGGGPLLKCTSTECLKESAHPCYIWASFLSSWEISQVVVCLSPTCLPACRSGWCNLLIRAGYGLALNLRRGEKQATAAVTCCPLLLCACNNSSSTIITIVAITIQLSCPRIPQHLSSVCVLCSAQWEMLQTHKDGDRMGCGPRTTVIRVDDGNQQVNSPSEHLLLSFSTLIHPRTWSTLAGLGAWPWASPSPCPTYSLKAQSSWNGQTRSFL